MSEADGGKFYDAYVKQKVEPVEDRLERIVKRFPAGASSLLDIGCGMGRNLLFFKNFLVAGARLCGIDVAPSVPQVLESLGFEGRVGDASRRIPYEDASFDIVVAGEVIEHVVDTDAMLLEIRRVLRPNGVVILTTPNLAYVPNRVLLALGIQPLFTETSLKKNLGRRFKVLGQGGSTQGHLRIFTLGAALELMAGCDLVVDHFEGYCYFQSGLLGAIDRALALKASFAAGFVISGRPVAL